MAGALALVAVQAPAPAHAQGLFDVLRNIFGGGRTPQRIGPPLLLDGFPGELREVPEDGGGPYASYCVRLCDGRYFPLPASGAGQSPQQTCSSMCPASKTEVFAGSGISHAVAQNGKQYSSLPNAFVYRERIVDDCTCTGGAATGVANVNIESDPTLRPGDIVVTEEGPKVFRGDRRLPHKSSDFVPAKNDKRLPQNMRQSLSDMRIAQPRERATAERAKSEAPPLNRQPALGFAPESDSTMRGFNPQN
jgi:hypothetical protein